MASRKPPNSPFVITHLGVLGTKNGHTATTALNIQHALKLEHVGQTSENWHDMHYKTPDGRHVELRIRGVSSGEQAKAGTAPRLSPREIQWSDLVISNGLHEEGKLTQHERPDLKEAFKRAQVEERLVDVLNAPAAIRKEIEPRL